MSFFTAIRADEKHATISAFVTLLAFMSAHAVLETARDALFLAETSAARLPWVYISIAVLSLILTQLPGRSGTKRPSLSSWLFGAGVVTLAFWGVVQLGFGWVYYLLYIWSGVIATLILIRFWLLQGDRFTASQAKRVFAVIGLGSVIGAMLGSGVAALLSFLVPAEHLLLCASGLFMVTAIVPRAIRSPDPEVKQGEVAEAKPEQAPSWGLADKFRVLSSRPYARRVALLVFVSTVSLTIADFIFKSAVDRHVDAARMDTFFAVVYFGLNGLSLLAQLFLVRWVVRRFNLAISLAVLPFLLVGGAVAVAATGGLAAALVIKATDGSLKHSLHRTASELLFVPMSGTLRSRVKGLIDVMGQRGGQALASILILAFTAFGAGPEAFGVVLAVLCTFWLIGAVDTRRHHMNVFRQALENDLVKTRIEFPELDLDTFESLISRLNSDRDAEVLAVLEILAKQGKLNAVQSFILFHPAPEVVITALQVFTDAGRTDFANVARRRLRRAEPEVRAAIHRALSQFDLDEEELRAALEDESELVRATAMVHLIGYGAIEREDAEAMLEEAANSDSIESRAALARAMGYQPTHFFAPTLIGLAGDERLEVRLEAARAMARQPSMNYLPALMDLLTHHSTRPEARDAIVALGAPGLEALRTALSELSLPRSIRLHLPRTITRFHPQEASQVLLDHIGSEPDGAVRFKTLRGLEQLRRANPKLKYDTGKLQQGTTRAIRRLFELLEMRMTLTREAKDNARFATPVQQFIVRLLRDREKQGLGRLGQVLGLQYSAADVAQIWRGLNSRDRQVRSNSMELLAHIVPHSIREPILGLVDRTSDADRLTKAGEFYSPQRLSYSGVLQRLLAIDSDSIRSLVVYHIGEVGLSDLRPDIEAIAPQKESYLETVTRRVLSALTADFAHES